MADIPRTCPHCGSRLKKWLVPEDSSWDDEFFFVCFNDDCPYFVRGWEHMQEKYAVKASYRFRVDPANGKASPLAVWSTDAIKDRILDATVIAGADDAPDQGSSP